MPNDDSTGGPGHCADWAPTDPAGPSPYPHSARVYFELPVSSDALFLLARGSLAHGSVSILADSNDGGDKVKAEVVISYFTQEARDRAKVCSLQRTPGSNGVGIFVSSRI
jgi:hypothetical protein